MEKEPTPLEHHGREHLSGGLGLLIEMLAIIFGGYAFALGAAVFFWLAAKGYSKKYIGHWKPVPRWTAYIVSFLVIAVLMCLVPFLKNRSDRPKMAKEEQNGSVPQLAQTPQSPQTVPARPAKPMPKLRSKITQPQQDNSVHVDNGSKLDLQSNGNCSPNIVGGSNTVTCTPVLQKTGLELSVSLVDPNAPAIVLDNQTDNLIEGIQWELVMFRTTDQAFFSYVVQQIGYVKPHSKSPRFLMNLNALGQAGGGQIANGESFIGTLSVDCPTCLGTTLIVSFDWGNSGWFYKVPGGNGRLVLPKGLAKSEVSQFIESVNTVIQPVARSPII